MKAVYILALSGIVFAVVAIREWDYRTAHPHALGPSGYIVAVAVAGALAAFAAAAQIYRSGLDTETRDRAHASRGAALEARLEEVERELKTLTLRDLEINQIEQDMAYEDELVAASVGLTVEEFEALPPDERGAASRHFWERPESWIELRRDELARSVSLTRDEFASLSEAEQKAIVIAHRRSSPTA